MHVRHPQPVTDELVDEIARLSGGDRRTVIRRLAGLQVRGAAGRSIDDAIDKVLRPTSEEPRPAA